MKEPTRRVPRNLRGQKASSGPGDSGESRALSPSSEQIYRQALPFVWKTLRLWGVYHEQDREDLAHDVFVAVLRQAHTYDPSASLRAWLASFTWRVLQNYRRSARHRREQIIMVSEIDAIPTGTPNPEELLARAERKRLVQRLLESIPEERRFVLIMKEFQDLDVADIARAMNVPLKTIYDRLSRARKDFAKAALRLAEDEREALGVTGVGSVMLGAAEMDALFAERRADATLDGADVPPDLRERLWSRLQASLCDLHAKSPAPAADTRAGDATARVLARLSTLKSPGLGLLLFLSGAATDAALRSLLQPSATAVHPTASATAATSAALSGPSSIPLTYPTDASTEAASAPPATASATAPIGRDEIERAIIHRARERLNDGQFRGALTLLDEHARGFPAGKLVEERDAMVIAALFGLGDRKAAAERLARFRARYPESALLDAMGEVRSPGR